MGVRCLCHPASRTCAVPLCRSCHCFAILTPLPPQRVTALPVPDKEKGPGHSPAPLVRRTRLSLVPTGLADGFGEGRLPTPNDSEIHPTWLVLPSPAMCAGVRPYSLS
jgi:hypothetical protein